VKLREADGLPTISFWLPALQQKPEKNIWKLMIHEILSSQVQSLFFPRTYKKRGDHPRDHLVLKLIFMWCSGEAMYLYQTYTLECPILWCIIKNYLHNERGYVSISDLYIRVSKVVVHPKNLLTQWRYMYMSKFHANIYAIATTSNYLSMVHSSLKKSEFLKLIILFFQYSWRQNWN
jgi:hypothetical protein